MISYNSSINFGIQGGAICILFTPYANCRAIVCSRYVQLCERAPDTAKRKVLRTLHGAKRTPKRF